MGTPCIGGRKDHVVRIRRRRRDNRERAINTILAVALASVIVTAGDALGQGACCLPDGDCTPAADEPECGGLGGIFLDGADCGLGACDPGACCDGASCGVLGAFDCIASGRTFAGAGTSCLDDPCAAGVGACCLAGGGCDDISPEACAGSGGTWLGAGTSCAEGDCDDGACCAPGSCVQGVRFLCLAGGGVFVPGGDCAEDGCDLPDDCAADSIYAQRRQPLDGGTTFVSEDGAGLARWDRYDGVAGTIERLRWWGLDLAYDGEVFTECEETDSTFRIVLAEDDAGEPGFSVCSVELPVQRTPTGIVAGGFELNQYDVSLPEPCVLPTGWLSIGGLGDPDCWFLWMGSSEGDGPSVCYGCEQVEQLSDLSFCFGGTLGGIFGACCDLSTAECTEDVAIEDCLTVDRRFVPDTACVDLDPPCFLATGACCFPDGGFCDITIPDDCAAAGGDWIGADTDCIQCPVVGACCLSDGTCTFLEQEPCALENGTWLGQSGRCEECPTPPVCPGAPLFGQDADGPDGFEGLTSEASAGIQRFEDFDGVAGAIAAITWWGVDLDNIEGTNAFIECDEPDPTFQISMHEDAGGVPGAAVCTYTLLATRSPLGINYLGAELNEYHVELPEPCVLVRGWVSIVGLGDEECWFLWMSSGAGGSWCDGCGSSAEQWDLAICLEGAVGGVLGACCDQAGGGCAEGVDIADCSGAGQRFEPGLTCAELDPPCGVTIGACCFETAGCALETAEACAGQDGTWLGADTLCDQCPCLLPCPPRGVLEGEPTCFDDYEDAFNGGCDVEEPVFSSIALGSTVCGETGTYLVGVEIVADFDWYAIEVPRPMELTWTVDAEFPAVAAIVDASMGCPGEIVEALGATEPCETLSVTATVEAGAHWLVVQPLGAGDEAGCGARYVASATTSCPADTNGDGAVDVDDLVAIILAWGTDDPATDLDGSGVVDVDDLVTVILAWGPCGGGATASAGAEAERLGIRRPGASGADRPAVTAASGRRDSSGTTRPSAAESASPRSAVRRR
jgi:hypothetical protein